jgi:hypothetical protein
MNTEQAGFAWPVFMDSGHRPPPAAVLGVKERRREASAIALRRPGMTGSREKEAGAKPALEHWGIEPCAETGPDPLKPRGAGGLRNPELLRTGS